MIRFPVPASEQRHLALRFWRSAAGFWCGRSALLSWSLAALLVVIVLLQLLVQYRLNLWQRDFYDGLERRLEMVIWDQVVLFVGLVLSSTVLALAVTWGRMTTQRRWRRWLTENLIQDWLKDALERDGTAAWPPSPEYRVAEDVNVATQLPIDFAIGLLSSVLGAITFIGVLWSVGGDLPVPALGSDTVVPGYLVLAAVLYAAINSGAMLLVGRRLVPVIEEKNQAEAELRQAGTCLREVSEGMRSRFQAPSDGQATAAALARVDAAWRHLCGQLLRTLFISHGSALMAPLIALMLCVPKYLAGGLTLGEVMQLAAAFVTVQAAFNWLVDNYPRIAEWLSAVNRVALLLVSFDPDQRDDHSSAGTAGRVEQFQRASS